MTVFWEEGTIIADFWPAQWEERAGPSRSVRPREERTFAALARPNQWEERVGPSYGVTPREEEEFHRSSRPQWEERGRISDPKRGLC